MTLTTSHYSTSDEPRILQKTSECITGLLCINDETHMDEHGEHAFHRSTGS